MASVALVIHFLVDNVIVGQDSHLGFRIYCWALFVLICCLRGLRECPLFVNCIEQVALNWCVSNTNHCFKLCPCCVKDLQLSFANSQICENFARLDRSLFRG